MIYGSVQIFTMIQLPTSPPAAAGNTTVPGVKVVEQISLKRPARLEELNGPLLLLASKSSSYMNGAIIEVDGGFAIDIFLHEELDDCNSKQNSFFKSSPN